MGLNASHSTLSNIDAPGASVLFLLRNLRSTSVGFFNLNNDPKDQDQFQQFLHTYSFHATIGVVNPYKCREENTEIK